MKFPIRPTIKELPFRPSTAGSAYIAGNMFFAFSVRPSHKRNDTLFVKKEGGACKPCSLSLFAFNVGFLIRQGVARGLEVLTSRMCTDMGELDMTAPRT